ncbi:YceI family protein [Marinobacter sp.]|uniref:YceI family protein n=1 Tax=Marinobacter sp. TaxID=50741 RepID=UPI00384DE513
MNTQTMTGSIRKLVAASLVSVAMVSGAEASEHSGTYAFDTEGQHQFIIFKISHLGYSWLYGRFNEFDGKFTYDAANPEQSSVEVTVNTASVDSNHGERDKHLRSDDFLFADEYPQATFTSKRVVPGEDGKEGQIVGDLTLRGVTKEITLDAEMVGHGDDPWGGYRMGFEASTELRLKDFDIPKDLGEASETVELIISVEGIRQ